MTSKYFNELDDSSKSKYLEKLSVDGCILPDPLDEMVRHIAFARDANLWPSIEFGDLYMYLVEEEGAYTREIFKNYKELEGYNYYLSGKINNVLAYKNIASNVSIMTCDAQESQSLNHKPWIISSLSGEICSGHCTCMEGLGEVCLHVTALLFTIEAATRKGLQSPSPHVTSQSCKSNRTKRKGKPVTEINVYHKRKNPLKKTRVATRTHVPSEAAYEKFIAIMKEDNPDAPYLLMLSDEDTSTASECESEEQTATSNSTAENSFMPEEKKTQTHRRRLF